jgi:hypothetical protein
VRSFTERERWLLYVANQRCESDLADGTAPTPRWLGSGARIVQRRVTALQGLAAGEAIVDVASRAGLSAERVAALAADFDEHGIACLPPSFAGGVDVAITDQQQAAISALLVEHSATFTGSWKSGSAEQSVQIWLPYIRDLAVERGIAADLSDRQVTTAVAQNRPRTGNGPSLTTETPGEASGQRTTRRQLRVMVITGAALVVAAAAFAVIAVRTGEVGAVWGSIFTGLFGALMTVGLVNERRARRIATVMASKGSDGGTPTTGVRSGQWPTVEIINVSTAAEPPSPGAAGPNSAGPVRILFLWLFDRTDGLTDMITHGWATLGPVTLLISPRVLSTRARKRVISDADEHIIDDEESLRRRLQNREAPELAVRRLPDFLTMGPFSYTGFPITTLLCTDRFWKTAFAHLAAESEVALVDLSGFDAQRQGLRYEVQHVVDAAEGAVPVLLVGLGDPPEHTIDAVAAATENDHLTFYRTPPGDLVLFLRGNVPLEQRSRIGRALIERTPSTTHSTGDAAGAGASVAEKVWAHVQRSSRRPPPA